MAPKAVLIGLPGAGKSTIGKRLAKALGVAMCDTDAQIEAIEGRSVAEIFATDGEAGFRRIEEEVVRRALIEQDGVVSLGGGAITTPGVRAALVGQPVVYLEISLDEGVRRTGGSTVRPLLAGSDRRDKYLALVTERVPLYRRVATVRVNTNRRNPRAVVRYIVGQLESDARRQATASATRPASPTPTPATAAALAARRTGGRK